MPPKKTDEELLAQFDDLGVEDTAPPTTAKTTKAASKPAPAAEEADPLAELELLASQKPISRPGTPGTRAAGKRTTATPPLGRPSEDKSAVRKSGETTRSFHTSSTPGEPVAVEQETTPEPAVTEPTASGGGGWWGGLLSTASAAVKQAEAAYKEIQQNEEAQRWAQQVKGNVGALKGLGGELRTLALPTFTTLIHTLAPPISSHERLQIHITHDLSGYPSLDPLVYAVFSRVMAQVEGGDLLVIQRGQEAAPRRGGDGNQEYATAGWSDGPWWRTVSLSNPRSISAVKGAVEASKLARASAESYATDFYASRGGVEEAAKQASESLTESNPTRVSDIFLSIQALSRSADESFFAAGASAGGDETVREAETPNDEICFAIYLHDPVHGIKFHTISQAIPQQWVDWLDETPALNNPTDPNAINQLPESIAEIIESGGVDPREWVSEWIEETLSLSVGVIAQRYVAKRMGVGEGGVNKGKMRAEKATVVEDNAGEAARGL